LAEPIQKNLLFIAKARQTRKNAKQKDDSSQYKKRYFENCNCGNCAKKFGRAKLNENALLKDPSKKPWGGFSCMRQLLFWVPWRTPYSHKFLLAAQQHCSFADGTSDPAGASDISYGSHFPFGKSLMES